MIGERLPLTVGPVAPGGHCVARTAEGQVVFVRHALPGEEVLAEVTEEHRGYLRADVVSVRVASPDRVAPPCRYAGRCGAATSTATASARRNPARSSVISATTVSPGNACRTKTTRPSGARATQCPPWATRPTSRVSVTARPARHPGRCPAPARPGGHGPASRCRPAG